MTNLEKIKEMTLEEMTKFVYNSKGCNYCINNCFEGCRNGIKKWLESEVENNA